MAENIVDITASIPEHRIRVFNELITRYQKELGNSQAVAVRRCVVALLKSLRKRTKKAKPKSKLAAFSKYTGNGPHYITPKRGSYAGISLHRWNKAGYKKDNPHTYIYAAESRRDAWERHGRIKRHGLAKKSWSWFMKSLFHRAEPEQSGNSALKIDSRMVEKDYKEIVTGKNPRIEVTIVNKLDYISKALSENDLSEAMSAANSSLINILNRKLDEAKQKL